MFTVKKYIIGLILGALIFSGIAIVDDIIVKISMAAASSLAFSIVGALYTAGLISSRADGGKARLYIFIILLVVFLYIFTQIAKGVIWLFLFPTWIYIVIVIISIIILISIMTNRQRKSAFQYKATGQKNSFETKINHSVERHDNQIVERGVILKSIPELLVQESEKDYILAANDSPHSPGLKYVKVYKKSLAYSDIKGYIKMDNAIPFWGDIYYANDKRWYVYID